jgi:hypothetical protein
MPAAIPLIAAAGTAAAGVAAVTAGSAIIGGMMIAGAAMTAVGTLTGNKNLTKWGGLVSLAGGVSGLATGAWETAAGSLAQETAKEGAIAFEHGAGAYTGEAAASASGSFGNTMSAVTQANAGLESLPAGVSPSASLMPSQQAGAAASAASPTSGAVSAYSTPQGIANAVGNPAVASNGGGILSGIRDGVSGVGDTIKSGMAWAEKNPRLAQAGAGILSGAMGAIGQQEAIKTQIKLQEDANARARQRLNDSVKGLTVPVYVPKGS